MITYQATSLEDIAQQFDLMATRAIYVPKRTKAARAIADAECRTWQSAAAMVRATTLINQEIG